MANVDQDSNLDGATEGSSNANAAMKRNSDDPRWNYGTLCDPLNKDAIKCNLCGFICKAGITRLKYHVSGLKGDCVAICKNASKEDKVVCVALIEQPKEDKIAKRKQEEEMRAEVEIEVEDNEFYARSKKKRQSNLRPLDKFTNPINPEDPFLNMRQQNLLDAPSKERTHSLHQLCARWMESLLKEEVHKTEGLLKKQEEEWERSGYSIMTDGWTNKKRRNIMNFCVNSREGTIFHSFVECCKDSHTGPFIFDYVEKCIEDVGAQNMIQVVTDNASNNMAATKLLIEKRPDKFTKCKDILRPGVTRFATKFLTLQIKLLQLADGDRKASMGFLYGELRQANEYIKMAFEIVEINYCSIIEIIETRAKGRINSPLHMTTYLLNPYFFYNDQSIKDNVMVSDAIFICVEKFFRDDIDKQAQVINMELPKYKEKEGDFGRILAAKGCSENSSSYC
uniref:DUF659 domain-containing protein n=1 Tax=Lactuca sativa TaxID=4236 RepID=A0A9R1WZI7_LACSA|nr:hypothetical protein LSAT_V11C800441650 [Lactuca sativa]